MTEPSERGAQATDGAIRYQLRIIEVLRKYNIELPLAPLEALASAMQRISENAAREEGRREERE